MPPSGDGRRKRKIDARTQAVLCAVRPQAWIGHIDGQARSRGAATDANRQVATWTLDKHSCIATIRLMDAPDRIVLDAATAHGKPVIRGTRVPVTVVVGSLAGGMTFEEVQREYDVTIEDVRAALKFVSEVAEQESFHPLPAA